MEQKWLRLQRERAASRFLVWTAVINVPLLGSKSSITAEKVKVKQPQAVLLSDIDSIGGVIFWIKIKSVALTESCQCVWWFE